MMYRCLPGCNIDEKTKIMQEKLPDGVGTPWQSWATRALFEDSPWERNPGCCGLCVTGIVSPSSGRTLAGYGIHR